MKVNRFLRISIACLITVAQAPVGLAGVIAFGKTGFEGDTKDFVIARSTGKNCVTVDARGNLNPLGSAVGVPGPPFGNCVTDPVSWPLVGLPMPGLENTLAKGGAAVTSNLSNIATRQGDFAQGRAVWTYTPGAVFDTATYTGNTNVGTASPANSFARARAEDPTDFYAPQGGQLQVNAYLDELLFEITDPAGAASFEYDYSLDGQSLFSLLIGVEAGFTTVEDLTIEFLSDLGPLHDALIESALEDALNVDASAGKITLSTENNIPLNLYQNIKTISAGPDQHSLAGGVMASSASVPEPSSIVMLVLGLMGLSRLNRIAKYH